MRTYSPEIVRKAFEIYSNLAGDKFDSMKLYDALPLISEDCYSNFSAQLLYHNRICSMKNFLFKNELKSFYNYILDFINSYTYILHLGFFNSKIYFESAKRDLYFKLHFKYKFHKANDAAINLNLMYYDSYPGYDEFEVLNYMIEAKNTSISNIYNIYG